MHAGDIATVNRPVPMIPGGLVTLQPGDRVTIVTVGQEFCEVRVFADDRAIVPRSALDVDGAHPGAGA